MSLLSRLTRKKANWGRNSLGVGNYVVDRGAQALFDKAQIMGRDGTLSWTRASTEIGYPEIFGAKTATADNPVSKELPCGLTMVQVDGGRTNLIDPEVVAGGWTFAQGSAYVATRAGQGPGGLDAYEASFDGTVNGNFEDAGTSNVTAGVTYTVSCWIRVLSGCTSGSRLLSVFTTFPTTGTSWADAVTTGEWTRVSVTATATSSARGRFNVRCDSAGVIQVSGFAFEAGSFSSAPKDAQGAFPGSVGVWSFDAPINTAARSVVAFGVYGNYNASAIISGASNHTFWWNATGLVAAGNLNLNADFGIAVDNNFLPAFTGQDATITPFQPFCLASIADGTTHTAIFNGGVATGSEPDAAPYGALNYLSVGSFDGAASQFLYGAEALAVFDYAITALDVSRMYRQFLREAFLT